MNVLHDFSQNLAPGVLTSHDIDPDWWRGAVIYQIYPRSFQDSNGDGIGDLRGITQRLPHIASLGVDAIWISPFFKSPMLDFGYDVSNYTEVDPMFGTMADFDSMIAEAHRLGLKVMIDQVISHSSEKHPWFVESRASRDNNKADCNGRSPEATGSDQVRRHSRPLECPLPGTWWKFAMGGETASLTTITTMS